MKIAQNSTPRRVFLLPGFGEDDFIFRNIAPALINYQIIVINYKPILDTFTIGNIWVEKFTEKLIKYYQIRNGDLLIGHSMGGYFAHQVQQSLHCPVFMHGSFTNPTKIKHLVKNLAVLKWAVFNNFFNSPVFREYMRFRYFFKGSAADVEHILALFGDAPPQDIYKMLLLLHRKKKPFLHWLRPAAADSRAAFLPTLMLHPSHDSIVAPPDEPYSEVAGDHFSIASNPQPVLHHLTNWLAQVQNAKKMPAQQNCNVLSATN